MNQPLPPVPPADIDGGAANAIANLPKGLAVLKMQHDSVMAAAAAHPRNLVLIVKSLKDQLAAFPSFAGKAVYNKPVGREHNRCGKCGAEFKDYRDRKCKNCQEINVELFKGHTLKEGQVELKVGQMRHAEGLSIHAAEALIAEWGHCAITVEAIDVDLQNAEITVSFVDLQNGQMRRQTKSVSKYITYRSGGQSKIDDDRFWNVVIPAKTSILLREVVLRSVPASVKEELFIAAKEAQEESLTNDQINQILETFAGKGVSQRHIEIYLGRPMERWTSADRGKLLGVWRALQDGETTIEELFGMMDEEPVHDDDPFAGGGDGGPATTEELQKLLEQIAAEDFATVPPRSRNAIVKRILALSPDEDHVVEFRKLMQAKVDGKANGGGKKKKDDPLPPNDDAEQEAAAADAEPEIPEPETDDAEPAGDDDDGGDVEEMY